MIRITVGWALLVLVSVAFASAAPPSDLADGVALVKQGRFADAVIVLDRALVALSTEDADPRDLIEAHLHLGAAYACLDQTGRAQAEFKEVLARAPGLEPNAQELCPKAVDLFHALQSSQKPKSRSSLKRGLIIGGAGAAAAATIVVATHGQNHPPTVNVTATPEGVAINAVTEIQFTASAVDPDNDRLTYEWNFGDGSSGSGAIVSHVFGAVGTFNVVVTVRDPNGGSATATVTVASGTVTGLFRPNNEDLRDYELQQHGSTLTGLVDPCCIALPFEGTLAHPREISIQYLFEDEGWTCDERIAGSFDETLNRITGTYTCTGCRQCRKHGTFPVVLTRQ